MKKGFKVALNLFGAAGLGAGGYFIGYRRGIKRLNEVVEYYDQKEATQEQIVSEKLVKPEELKPELLEQMEYGKEDEVIIEPEEDTEPEEAEEKVEEEVPFDIPEKVVEEKPKKRSSRKKAPYFIDEQTFADEAGDVGSIIELELDENGDVYNAGSDDIYEDWTRLGTTIINKMVREHDIEKVYQWYIRDERDDVYYDVTYRK